MVKAIIFDLDNTLVDFMGFKEKAVTASAEAMVAAGLEGSPEEVAKGIFDVYWETHIENPEIFQDFLMGKIGKVDYKYVAAGIRAYRQIEFSELKTYEGVKGTLQALRQSGLAIGILTDARALKAWFRLIYLGLQDEFDFVLSFTDTGVRKPESKAFQAAIDKVRESVPDIRPEEILMVGDSYTRDILGAKKAGMMAAIAKYGATDEPCGVEPDFILNSITDLQELAKQQNK